MVRANGQRDGVGKTRQLSGAFEHTGAILDPTRVSPYRPAAVAMPQSMRPDTRQHLTACTEPSQEMSSLLKQAEALAALRARLPRARSPAAVNPLRGSFAPLRPLRVTAAADRAGSPCGPARRLALVQQEQEEDSGSRIKGASIYWLPESVDAILLLRSFYKSGRWNCLQRMAMTPVGVSA